MVALRKAERRTSAGDAPFLGVAHSARELVWRERLDPSLVNLATAISQQHGVPDVLGRVLAARGVDLAAVATFLDPTVKALMPDPSSLTDMDKAAARLADAIEAREPIAVFGDYDVDGACSAALLARFLAAHGTAARIYIPDRLLEGYGPNVPAIEQLVAGGAKLIVCVDCGTTSFEPLEAAKGTADIIVIDHHQADERLPDVHALVNPNRQDDISGQGHLAAAGVTFLVLVALARELRRRGSYAGKAAEPDLLSALDLVALATVADVVALTGLNRAYVAKGLAVMRARANVGLKALADVAGLSEAPTTYHLGFILGPRINAGGRIGDAALGARLLATEDEVEAARIAALLDRLNKERKAIEQQMLEEAYAEADLRIETDPSLALVLVGSEAWHKGIVGLVASRLAERFRRPACAIAWEKEVCSGALLGAGSLRSVAGVDIGGAVRRAVAGGHLLKGGGHAMAAGLTVKREKLEELTAFFASELAHASARARERASLEIDGALTAGAASLEFLDLLESAGPFGQGNPEPRFAFPAHRVKFAKVAGSAHVRAVLEASDGARLEAIAFRALDQPLGKLLLEAGGMPVHVAGQLRRDTWGGRNRVHLTIEDAAAIGR